MFSTIKCYLKKGDIVKIISGDDKGKVSEITNILRDKNQICVKGVNIKKKNITFKTRGKKSGKIIEFEAPINSSNAMLYTEEGKCTSRVSMFLCADGKKIRVLKKLMLDQQKDV